ncbi:MAG TPA: GH116 family glycosyl hydrolase [Pseudonocardia sp.]|nr:GH116 family glycosyl hydrolase [Pseudonocardia sp.]
MPQHRRCARACGPSSPTRAGPGARRPEVYERRLEAARGVLERLWNGEFYRAASEGKYTGAVMPDSVMGLFYADLCGAAPVVPRERLAAHLRAAYEICHRGYADGRFGPLLIGERALRAYSRRRRGAAGQRGAPRLGGGCSPRCCATTGSRPRPTTSPGACATCCTAAPACSSARRRRSTGTAGSARR